MTTGQTTTRTHPNPKRAEKGLSVRGLLNYAIDYVRAHAVNVVIKSLKGTKTKLGRTAIVAVCVDQSTKNRIPHKVTVIGFDRAVTSMLQQKKVLVDCDCEDFTFTSEYALWTWGAAKIKRCNGDPAVIRNPANYPYYCKHLYAVLKEIKRKSL